MSAIYGSVWYERNIEEWKIWATFMTSHKIVTQSCLGFPFLLSYFTLLHPNTYCYKMTIPENFTNVSKNQGSSHIYI